MVEEWKDVIGYAGRYQISNFGNVKSIKSKMILKPRVSKKGYLNVALYLNGFSTYFTIHRLVALHFIPNPQNKPEVNHKDGNKENNFADNLEWNTTKENINHAVKHDLISDRKGEAHGFSKLTNKEVLEIITLLKTGYKTTRIAKMFKVDRTTISGIKCGKSWTHLTGLKRGEKL